MFNRTTKIKTINMAATLPESNLITEVPSPDELFPGYGFHREHSYEPLAPELTSGFDPNTIKSEDEFNRLLLDNLSNQLQWAPDYAQSSLVRNGYAVARQIGDSVVRETDREAFDLIDGTRSAASFNTQYTGQSRVHGKEMGGHHSSNGLHQEMGVSVAHAYTGHAEYQAVENKLVESGAQVKPADLGLFIFLIRSGHEAGHAIQRGIDGMITNKLDLDYEERFAEGYGMTVVGEAARLLGYDAHTTRAVQRAVGISEADLKASGNSDHFWDSMPYTRPLSKTEVARTLHHESQLAKQRIGISSNEPSSHGVLETAPSEDGHRKERHIKRIGRMLRNVIGTPETQKSPEVMVTELIDRTERGLAELEYAPREQRKHGSCNFVPDILNYCTLNDAEQRGYVVDSNMYQLQNIHMAAAGINPDDVTARRAIYDGAFQHGFNVITIGRQSFLIDLTFAQFRGNDGYISSGRNKETDVRFNDNKLARRLVETGYVPLTNKNLREYLRLTTADRNAKYVSKATTDIFSKVHPLEPDYHEDVSGVHPYMGLQA